MYVPQAPVYVPQAPMQKAHPQAPATSRPETEMVSDKASFRVKEVVKRVGMLELSHMEM